MQKVPPPEVFRVPYEYSVPGAADDFLPQTEPRPASAGPSFPYLPFTETVV